MNKNKIILKSTLVIGLFVNPIFSMDNEPIDLSRQLSVDHGWEMIENSNDPIVDSTQDDFELKARAMGNTLVCLVEGAGVSLFNFGVKMIEKKIQTNINQFDQGVRVGSHLVGNLYGQGIAVEAAYENQKDLLRKK